MKPAADNIGDLTIASHTGAKSAFVLGPRVALADQMQYFLSAIRKVFYNPVFKDLTDGSVQSDQGIACNTGACCRRRFNQPGYFLAVDRKSTRLNSSH